VLGRSTSALLLVLLIPLVAVAQQYFRPPDLGAMKHLTTRYSDHAADIPGDETKMDYYQALGGEIVTIYSYKGRKVAYSVHSNAPTQKSYRIFLDPKGDGLFQEIMAGVKWQIPAWAR
jgi:hypothetical protein